MTYDQLKDQLQQASDETNKGNFDTAEQLANDLLAVLELPLHPEFVVWVQNNKQQLRANALLALATVEYRRGNFDNALTHAHRGLAIAEEENIPNCKAKTWNIIGLVYADLGNYDKALEFYNKAYETHSALGDSAEMASVTGNIGIIYRKLGNYTMALEFYNKALKTHSELGDCSRIALVTGNIGSVYQNLGSYDIALEYFNKALASHTELGETVSRARVTGNIGIVYYSIGTYGKALEYFNDALEMHVELGELTHAARVTGNVGNVYSSLGNYDKALEYYNKALASHKELGDIARVANVSGNIGNVYNFLGNSHKALEYYNKAIEIHSELGEIAGIAHVTGNIGNVYSSLGDYDKALEYYNKARVLHADLGDKHGLARVTGNIGSIYKQFGSYDKALEYFNKAFEIQTELGAMASIANALGNIGNVYADKKFDGYNPTKAEEYLLKAIDSGTQIGAKPMVVGFHKSLADLYELENRWQDFAVHFKKYIELKDEVNVAETKKQDAIREQRKEIELAKAAAAAKLSATTTLLHRVLPESIASRMIAGEEDISDYFPSVSILFADIAGFTPISAQMPATIVVRFLNYVFGEFDKIMKKHGCEKIKTIGDGYMAVAGAPIECADHAERIAGAALAMQEAIHLPEEFREYLPKGKEFGIRVGLHTGAVVGGVIGDERFVYDIYSDAVNTASRMESHGKADKIHVSEEFKQAFLETGRQGQPPESPTSPMSLHFAERGEMAIKGKGMMKTYFLEKANL